MRFASTLYLGVISSSPVRSHNPPAQQQQGFVPQPIAAQPIVLPVVATQSNAINNNNQMLLGYNAFQQAQDLEVAKYKEDLAAQSNKSWMSNVRSKGLVKWAADLLGAGSLVGSVSRDTSLTEDLSSTSTPVSSGTISGVITSSSSPSSSLSTPTTSGLSTSLTSVEATDSTKPKSCKTGLATCSECLEVSGCFWCSVGSESTSSSAAPTSSSASVESRRLKRSLVDLPTGTCTTKDLSTQSGHLQCVKTCSNGAWSSWKFVEVGALVVLAVVAKI